VKKAKLKADSLFHKFNLAEKLREIEEAENEQNFAKIIGFSTKLQFLFQLLENFRREGKRCLVFSMSKKMLSMIESILKNGFCFGQKVKYMRIDGDTEI